LSYILKYIAEGEHQRQDFKVKIDDSRKIAKTLSAFANTDGGRLLIGVKDNGVVCGVPVEEEFHMIEAAAEMYCDPPVEFQNQVWKVDNLSVLEVIIQPSNKRPHFAINEEDKRRAYIRQADENLSVNGVMLKVWQHEKQVGTQNFEYDYQKEKLFDYLQSRGSAGFRRISRITKLNGSETEDLIAQLIAWDVLESEKTKQGFAYKLKQADKSTLVGKGNSDHA
jgi:predicted HTH transcriptional regulator